MSSKCPSDEGYRPFEPAIEGLDYLTAAQVRRACRHGGPQKAQELIDKFEAQRRAALVRDSQQLDRILEEQGPEAGEAAREWHHALHERLSERADEPRQALNEYVARGVRC